jgi:hypothetical protein
LTVAAPSGKPFVMNTFSIQDSRLLLGLLGLLLLIGAGGAA